MIYRQLTAGAWSHILSVGIVTYTQSPLKIRPKSFALSYCAKCTVLPPSPFKSVAITIQDSRG